MKNIVSIKNMKKSFFGVIAMDGMNFSINESEVHCLIGENGCGKSTMIKVISGFYPYDQGELYINEKHYKKITPSESMKEGIEVIYQDFSLFSNMTIAENIMMYHTIGSGRPLVKWKNINELAGEALQKINFDIDPAKYVYQLTVAQKQMVAICRAIAQDARLIIMDEATAALTTNEVSKLFEVVSGLKAQGVAVLFVSHKLDEVLRICDRITVMRNGKNVFESSALEAIPSKEEMIYHMTGKKIEESSYSFAPGGETPIMRVNELTLEGCFKNISFSLHKGEILGITGLLGCGREELAESLFGVLPAQTGDIFIDGIDIGILRSVQEAIRQDIAYLPEDRLTKGLHLEQSIADNSISRIIGQFVKKSGFLNVKALREQKKKGLSTIRITGMRPDNPVKSLSGGNQQKVALVKWLTVNPKILILNCPTIGVDVGAKFEIHSIIKDIAKSGKGVILISDDIPEVMQVCSRVLIMKEGRISSEINVSETTIEDLEVRLASGENDAGEAV